MTSSAHALGADALRRWEPRWADEALDVEGPEARSQGARSRGPRSRGPRSRGPRSRGGRQALSVRCRRRRAVLAMVVLVLSTGLLGRYGPSVDEGVGGSRGPVGPAVPVRASWYVVAPGDTLWSIAERLRPGQDPRPVMDWLSQEVPGGVLTVGRHLVLPSGEGP